jgi:nitrate reductase assembly molybdenum cofactor insertion protein NarJ
MQSTEFSTQVVDGDMPPVHEARGDAPVDPQVLGLLREAARWRLLGRLFECPTPAWRHDVARLAREVDDSDLVAAAGAALVTATEGQYHSVFGPGGPAPPREVSYHDTIELGSLMSKLTGCYAAFGYHPPAGEPPDHVAVEADFLAYLHLKEAYAVASGDADHAAVTAQAAARFRRDHLAVLAGPLASALAQSDIPYLIRASAMLTARAGQPPARTRLPVMQPLDEDAGSEITCCDE